MVRRKTKFTIKFTDDGVIITSSERKKIYFSAGEALMILDILNNEKEKLTQIKEAAEPISLKLNVSDG